MSATVNELPLAYENSNNIATSASGGPINENVKSSEVTKPAAAQEADTEFRPVENKNKPSFWEYLITFKTPTLSLCYSIAVTIVNIFLPGIGTMIASCSKQAQVDDVNMYIFWIGVLQLVCTIIFFLGWIWALVWSIFLIINSKEIQEEKTPSNEKKEAVNDNSTA